MAQTNTNAASGLIGAITSLKGLGWELLTGVGVVGGLAAWTLLIGWGVRQQISAGDWIAVALLTLWLLAPYLASVVYIVQRLDLFSTAITTFAQYYAVVLVGSLWLFFWAGKSLWLEPIGQQLAAGNTETALIRIGFLVLPIVPIVLYWRKTDALQMTGDPDSTV